MAAADAATITVAPMLSSSGPTRLHFILLFAPEKITNLFKKLKMYSLESTICTLHGILNPIFVNGVIPELLFNQFCRVLSITT